MVQESIRNGVFNLKDKIDDDEIIIIGGDFNVGVTRIGKNKYTYEKRSEYEEYNMIYKNNIMEAI